MFEAAGTNGVMIEINANPHRLDIDWRLMKQALDYGVLFSIHPDAHSVDEILNMLTNVILVLPTLAVLIILHAYVGIKSVPAQALFIGLFSWPWVARAVRAQTLSLRSREFVDLALFTGAIGKQLTK